MRNYTTSLIVAGLVAMPMMASAGVPIGQYDVDFESDTLGAYHSTASNSGSVVNTSPRNRTPASTDTVLVENGFAGLSSQVAVLRNIDVGNNGHPKVSIGGGGANPFNESGRISWDMSISSATLNGTAPPTPGNRFLYARLQNGGSLVAGMAFRYDPGGGEDGDIVCNFCGGTFGSSMSSGNAGWKFDDPMTITVDLDRATDTMTWNLSNSLGTRDIGSGVQPDSGNISYMNITDGGSGIGGVVRTYEVGVDNFRSIPEPGSLALIALGAAAIGIARRRRN